MKTFASYLKSWKKGTGFLHGTSSGYLYENYTCLGFSWRFNGVLRYFTFAVLPFDLSGARFCFTKFLRPLVKRWRSMGHTSFVYLDDGFGSQLDKCSAAAAAVIQTLWVSR